MDDGSPDKSGNICDEYAAKDSRIKVIHKVNGGVSSARQMGLEFCTGDYIVHADSDDWLSPIMLELLSSHAKETDADVILFDFIVSPMVKNYSSNNNQQPLRISKSLRIL